MASVPCKSCAYEEENGVEIDDSRSNVEWAEVIGASEAAIRRHKAHRAAETPLTEEGVVTEKAGDTETGEKRYTITAARAFDYSDFVEFIRQGGQDPDEVDFDWGVTTNPSGGYWNKINRVRPKRSSALTPDWDIIHRADQVTIDYIQPATAWTPRDGLAMSLKAADTQIGFRALPDGRFEPFHDERAMDVFVEVVRQEQPESVIILGDFLDLPSQSRWAQEAGFARTTQMALNAAHTWLVKLRTAAPTAQIVIIEGNHDKRMQSFIEANALAAFGITRANAGELPVMSLPFLLRLDELGIEYVDAYPAGAHWDDERTRNIHGTRANSKGSTMAQYATDLPHINTWAGHTHRAEIVYKTVLGPRGEAIESYSANPGALCRVDGTVPSVHGALHADGTSAKVVEDWQQGFGVNLFNPISGQSWPQVYRIRDGKALYNGRMIG